MNSEPTPFPNMPNTSGKSPSADSVPAAPLGQRMAQRGLSRRAFLGQSAHDAAFAAATATGIAAVTSAAVASASTTSGTVQPSPAIAAGAHVGSKKIRLGMIGLRGQGLTLLREFLHFPELEIAAVCDVDQKQLKQALRTCAGADRTPPQEATNWLELARNPQLDAVVIATPDHWHFAMAQECLNQGRDLYLETPLTLRPKDAFTLQQTAQANQRIVQTGLPHRSSPMYQSAMELIHRGELGKIPLVRAWVTHQRPSIGQRGPTISPEGVDYQAWLGPAPMRSFQPNRFHQNWQWFWDYGNGELGAWGVPLLDVALWGMKLNLPEKVSASGGRMVAKDDGETPDTLFVQYDFPSTRLMWEHRSWSSHGLEGRSAATAFYGEKGTLIIDRGGWKIYGTNTPNLGESTPLWKPHLQNFLESIQTRQAPNASLEQACVSSAMALLGNISFRTGETISHPESLLMNSGAAGLSEMWTQQS